MKILSTYSSHKVAWQAALLAMTLLFSLILPAVFPLSQVYAQDCNDCTGGGGDGGGDTEDPPEPPDDDEPDDDPGGDPGDSDPPDDPGEPPHRPPCNTRYDPPTITANLTIEPSYPITLGQDPDDRGVDVRGITARGGARHCPNNGAAGIVAFSVVKVDLAQSSIAWINGPLARNYPGARVKGSYPFTPAFSASGLGSGQAQISFHFAPLDPGFYEVHLLVVQSDGQRATAILRVPVYLMESSIIQ